MKLRVLMYVCTLVCVVLTQVSCAKTAVPTQTAETPKTYNFSIVPFEGIRDGQYYTAQMRFTGKTAGHLGFLKVLRKDGKFVDVLFDEEARPNYYNRKYAGQLKRLNDYNKFMADANKGVSWLEGILASEKSIIANNSLTDFVDGVSGSSNSPKNGIKPLAKMIAQDIDSGKADLYGFHIVEKLQDGDYAELYLVYNIDGKIIDWHYDELVPTLLESKYYSFDYYSRTRYGFFFTVDRMRDKILSTGDVSSSAPIFEDDFHDATILKNYTAVYEKYASQISAALAARK